MEALIRVGPVVRGLAGSFMAPHSIDTSGSGHEEVLPAVASRIAQARDPRRIMSTRFLKLSYGDGRLADFAARDVQDTRRNRPVWVPVFRGGSTARHSAGTAGWRATRRRAGRAGVAIAILLPFVLAFAPPPLPAAPGPPERITTGSLLAPVADHVGVSMERLVVVSDECSSTTGTATRPGRFSVWHNLQRIAAGSVSPAGEAVRVIVYEQTLNQCGRTSPAGGDPPDSPRLATTEALRLATAVRDDFIATSGLRLEVRVAIYDRQNSWDIWWHRLDEHGIRFHQDFVTVSICDESSKPTGYGCFLFSLPPPGSPPPDPPAEFPDPVTTRWEGEITDFFRVMASNEKSNPLRDGRKPRITFQPGKRAIVTPNHLFRLPVSLPVEIVLERPIPAPSSYAYVVPFEILMPGSWSPFQCELWVDPGTLRVIGGVI